MGSEAVIRHTPGPWDVIGPITKVAGGEPFFVVYAEDVQIVRLKVEANARLIAAAPTMLAALKECREAISAGPFAAASAYQTVLEGIAKAEGQ